MKHLSKTALLNKFWKKWCVDEIHLCLHHPLGDISRWMWVYYNVFRHLMVEGQIYIHTDNEFHSNFIKRLVYKITPQAKITEERMYDKFRWFEAGTQLGYKSFSFVNQKKKPTDNKKLLIHAPLYKRFPHNYYIENVSHRRFSPQLCEDVIDIFQIYFDDIHLCGSNADYGTNGSTCDLLYHRGFPHIVFNDLMDGIDTVSRYDMCFVEKSFVHMLACVTHTPFLSISTHCDWNLVYAAELIIDNFSRSITFESKEISLETCYRQNKKLMLRHIKNAIDSQMTIYHNYRRNYSVSFDISVDLMNVISNHWDHGMFTDIMYKIIIKDTDACSVFICQNKLDINNAKLINKFLRGLSIYIDISDQINYLCEQYEYINGLDWQDVGAYVHSNICRNGKKTMFHFHYLRYPEFHVDLHEHSEQLKFYDI